MLYYLVSVLTLAVTYGIAGHLGRLLALPPGYATVLWPSSGLALGWVLIGGARVWPGIWLGSFLVNIGTAFHATDTPALLTSAAIPSAIGMGAAVQALVGASLIHRWVGFPNTLTRAKEIAALLVLGGPFSCLISATVGVTVLAISGQIPWKMYFIQWGVWWVGNTFGVLITAPLVLSWLPEARSIWRLRRISVALPLLVLVALALFVGVFGYTWAQERERLRALFEHDAEAVRYAIQNRLDESLRVLHVLGNFYSSISDMGGQTFHTFVQGLLPTHPGLRVLAWNPHAAGLQEMAETTVPGEESPDSQISTENAPGKLVQLAQLPEDMLLISVEPGMGNERRLGFDARSILWYSEELQQARDSGRPVVTSRLMLAQDSGPQFGLLVFVPSYGPGLLHTTAEERRQNLRGYVIGVFWIDDLVEAALQGLWRQGMVLRIEDEVAPAGQRLLYESRGQAAERAGWASDGGLWGKPAGMRWEATVKLAGHPWKLNITPTTEYLGALQSLRPWVMLGGGLLFTSLLGAFLLIITGRAVRIEQLMVERTAQLEASRRLEAEAGQRRREADVLADLARTINALDVDTVLQRVADGARELCDSDGAAIALREGGAEAAVIRYWAGLPYQGCQGGRIELNRGIGGLVLATGRPFRTDPNAPAPRLRADYLPIIQEGQEASVLVVPIRIGDQVDGLLYVGTARPRTFTDLDEAVLQRLADHAAIALHNARLYTAAEHRRHTAESLAEVGRLLSQSLDSLKVGQQVVDHVQKLLKARVAVLYQLEPTSSMLVVLAGRNSLGPAAPTWHSLAPGMGAVGLAVHIRWPVVTADILADPRITLPAAVRADIESTSVRAVLALPLLRDGTVIGALSIGDEIGRVFDKEDIELARLFADHATSSLANAQLYAEVQTARERLRDLSRQLLDAHEAERRRIAHELHDQAGQLLVSVHLALEAALTELPPQFRGCFNPMRDHLDDIETQLRRISHELRPTILDDLGLLPALQFLAEGVTARTGLRICVESSLEGRLAPHIETALYRIMQEGLTNITKHAAATHVRLQLRRDTQTVQGLLQDDGVGFDVDRTMQPGASRGLGLLGMQERLGALGGTLQIISSPGQGTTLQIMVPVTPWEAASEANGLGADVNSPAPARLGGTGVGNAA
jgi:signal transduction histidine kinase/CHASE1-domain containing sensor protein